MANAAPFLMLSAAFSLAAMISFLVRRKKMADWRRTQGTVIAVKKELRADSEGTSLMSSSVVEFRLVDDGRVVTFEDSIWSMPASHRVGQEVKVVYDPSNPASAMVAGYRQYFPTILWTFAALSALAIAGSKSQ